MTDKLPLVSIITPAYKRVRREAFGWANFVAAIACGPARNYALVHTLKAIWYHPLIVFEVAVMYLGALPSELHRRLARSVLSKGLHPSLARGA